MLRFATCLAVLAGLLLPAGAHARECRGDRLPPTIVSYPPRYLTVEPVEVAPGVVRSGLTFETALGNEGRGPLTMVGRRASRTTPVMRTTQVIDCERGRPIRRGDTGGMRFAPIPTHMHWHLRDLENYRLVSLETMRVTYAGKRGFCLGDVFGTEAAVAGKPRRAQFPGDLATACARDRPDALSIRLGLSPGWADTYPPVIEGQYVELTGLPAGRYRLITEVDHLRRLVLADRDRATAGVDIALSYPDGLPAIEELGACLTRRECLAPLPARTALASGPAALGRPLEGFFTL